MSSAGSSVFTLPSQQATDLEREIGELCFVHHLDLPGTGKNEITMAITTFDVCPKPNHAMNSGAKTIFGIAWNPTT